MNSSRTLSGKNDKLPSASYHHGPFGHARIAATVQQETLLWYENRTDESSSTDNAPKSAAASLVLFSYHTSLPCVAWCNWPPPPPPRNQEPGTGTNRTNQETKTGTNQETGTNQPNQPTNQPPHSLPHTPTYSKDFDDVTFLMLCRRLAVFRGF